MVFRALRWAEGPLVRVKPASGPEAAETGWRENSSIDGWMSFTTSSDGRTLPDEAGFQSVPSVCVGGWGWGWDGQREKTNKQINFVNEASDSIKLWSEPSLAEASSQQTERNLIHSLVTFYCGNLQWVSAQQQRGDSLPGQMLTSSHRWTCAPSPAQRMPSRSRSICLS